MEEGKEENTPEINFWLQRFYDGMPLQSAAYASHRSRLHEKLLLPVISVTCIDVSETVL